MINLEMERESHTKQQEKIDTAKRKKEHIQICLQENVNGTNISTGLERYRFKHNALPELAFNDIDLTCSWLNKSMKAPLLVSSMTGGTDEAGAINRKLAVAAEEQGWAIGLGSMRAAIEDEALAASFYIRREAPTVPIIANLGAVQLNYGYGLGQCQRAVELADADALVLHLNSMQEVFQPEGDTNFSNLLCRIEELCHHIQIPVGIKEVGWGIDGEAAAKLIDAGVSFIDTAGAGGTSWSQVEKFRNKDALRIEAAEAFANWGIPVVDSLKEVRRAAPSATVIASGGFHNGVEAAKALALGADLVGFGRALLPQAAMSDAETPIEKLIHQFERIAFELRTVMFGIGVKTVADLKRTTRLIQL